MKHSKRARTTSRRLVLRTRPSMDYRQCRSHVALTRDKAAFTRPPAPRPPARARPHAPARNGFTPCRALHNLRVFLTFCRAWCDSQLSVAMLSQAEVL